MPSCLTAVLVSPPSSWRDGNGEGDSTNSAHLGCARHGSDACRPRQRRATSRTSSESGLQLNCEGHHALQLRQLRQSSPSAYEAYLRGLGEKPHSVGSASSRPSRALIEHSRSPTLGSAEGKRTGIICIGGQAMRKIANGWEQIWGKDGWQRCRGG